MSKTAFATVRPTNVDRDKYLTFVNNCKIEGKNIRFELEHLLDLYNRKAAKKV
jgi:hypothetical protein